MSTCVWLGATTARAAPDHHSDARVYTAAATKLQFPDRRMHQLRNCRHSCCGGQVPSCLPREGRVLGGKVRTTGVGCRLAVPLPPYAWARPVLATASQVERSCHQSDANIPGSSLQVGGGAAAFAPQGFLRAEQVGGPEVWPQPGHRAQKPSQACGLLPAPLSVRPVRS